MTKKKRSKTWREKCPVCGKPVVDIRRYLSGDVLYVHTEKLVKEPFPHYDVTDSCFVRSDEVVK